MYKITSATKKIAKLTKKVRAVPGGTSAGKTIAILTILIDLAQRDETPTLTSTVAESIPHLKKGAIRDFKNIMKAHAYWKDELWNETDKIYTFESGSQLEFFSSDSGDKLRGARRDRCFMNEANNQTLDAFDQLEVRTKEFIILDWNPTNEFWYYTEVKGKRDDVEEITLNYKDNEALSQEIIDSIEVRKNRVNWWRVYGLGLLGEVAGRIFTGWQIIDEVPHEARLERRGLDFGYTNDPTTIVDVYYYNGGFILDERLFQKGMSNKSIADFINDLEHPSTVVIGDSAEPKSIDEIKSYGVNILPAQKGSGSVNQGIAYVQGQKISVTKRSINLIKEYRNYMWDSDREGKIINTPIDLFNHCIDAVRYALIPNRKKQESILTKQKLYTRRRNLSKIVNDND